jgi:hypothetical protein
VAAELLDLLPQVIEPERVLAQQAALQKQCVGCAGAVPDFAEAVDSLIGVDPNDRAPHSKRWCARPPLLGGAWIEGSLALAGTPHHRGYSQVCDLER